MAGVSDSFHERTNEALVATLVPRPDNLPLIVLVVEDSEDDELTSIIAEASAVPSPDYRGGWGAMVKGSAEGFQLTVKFLHRRGMGTAVDTPRYLQGDPERDHGGDAQCCDPAAGASR